MPQIPLLGVLCLLLSACTFSGKSEWVGHPLPPLDLSRAIQGPEWDPQDLRGSVVVMEIFQAGCPGCDNYSMPRAQQMFKQYQGDPRVKVVVVATALMRKKAAWIADDVRVKAVLDDEGWRMPVMRDRDHNICNLLHVEGRAGTPMTLVLDQNGIVRWHNFSGSSGAGSEIKATVRALLGETTPSRSE